MRRAAWLTDIHLNFVHHDLVRRFCRRIADQDVDLVFLGGDIGESSSVGPYLTIMEKLLRRPIYFVLGNHDYYGGSMKEVRERISQLAGESEFLHWLPECGVVPLGDRIALIGDGLWGDARNGDYQNSRVMLNDHVHIAELSGLDKAERQKRLNALGDRAAARLDALLAEALDRFEELIVLTHVPAFERASGRRGHAPDPAYSPHYSCRAAGDVFKKRLEGRTDRKVTVLAGHTHSAADVEILPNLRILVGRAKYGRPAIQGLLPVD